MRFKTLLLKVKMLENMRNLNAFPLNNLSMKEDKQRKLSCSISAVTSETCEVTLVDNILYSDRDSNM